MAARAFRKGVDVPDVEARVVAHSLKAHGKQTLRVEGHCMRGPAHLQSQFGIVIGVVIDSEQVDHADARADRNKAVLRWRPIISSEWWYSSMSRDQFVLEEARLGVAGWLIEFNCWVVEVDVDIGVVARIWRPPDEARLGALPT